MMDQTHIGYTYWQQPDVNKNAGSKIRVIVKKIPRQMIQELKHSEYNLKP